MSKKTIILDLDGPVLDGRERHYRCYADILGERGVRPVPIDEYWAGKRGRQNRRELLALSDATWLYDDFLAAWIERIETPSYLSLDRVQVGAVEMLQRWRSARLRIVLATMRNHPENLGWQLEHTGVAPLLDAVVPVGSGGAKNEAIAPHIAGVEKGELLWIGDTEVDVVAARALGCEVAAVTCGLRNGDYLQSLGPDQLVSDLSLVHVRGLD